MSKRKLKAPKPGKGASFQTVHDRRASALPMNAMLRVVVADDPYEIGAKVQAIASLRDDPLGRLHARDQIDQAQYQAGLHWQKLFRDSEIGGLKAMDTTKEPVDGGKMADTYTDRHRKAIMGLARAKRALGIAGDALVRDILGKRLFIEEAAAIRLLFTARGINFIGVRFRECLEALAQEFGFAGKN